MANLQPMIISASFGIGGILLATLLYVIVPSLSDPSNRRPVRSTRYSANKYYVDELYAAVIVKPLTLISRTVLWRGVDEGLIDTGLVNGLGRVMQAFGAKWRGAGNRAAFAIPPPGFWLALCY